MGNEICKPLGYIPWGEPDGMLNGRMYNDRAEDCCRTALASVLGMKTY